MTLSADMAGDHKQDSSAWMCAFTQQTYVHRAGTTLRERINLTGLLVGDVRAIALKKAIKKDDLDAIEEMQSKVEEMLTKYCISMDTEPTKYSDAAKLEIVNLRILTQLKEIIGRHNLTNQKIMSVVNANRATEPRLKGDQ